MINEILKAINERRSCRAYKTQPVPRELIEKLLHSAVMSPSACNRQPWNFTVVANKEKIGELGKKVMANLVTPASSNKPVADKKEMPFYGAPLLIIICAEKDYKWAKIDVGIAAENIMLAAHSLGLGSCYIGFALALNNDAAALEELGIPANCEVIAPLVFGYPDETPKFNGRKEARILKWIK